MLQGLSDSLVYVIMLFQMYSLYKFQMMGCLYIVLN
jgi:hypothetical protein